MEALDPALREEAYALQTLLGFELTGWGEGRARVELPVRPGLSNRQGLVHGGVHATLLDTAMGFSGCFTGDPSRRVTALTLSLTVNYISQVRGMRLIADATRMGGGRSTFFASATLSDETGHRVATATGVFRYRAADAKT
ncbi:PaaI family thioesterase [Roseibacterium sp. SDUM158017]|uniref:PaaI family thioesterase n=1 Tax=Roseicyclus salinarum TaxID=3036773 RepID=UPI0024154785|nr:PaaI family thioesterase [Roseibacterium sp. SDUM158017]MDG4647730.1 PaaI family thioesterase [Roseibacterium sp. SDUM158017]